VRYPLAANARGVAMHGGPKGFGSRVWRGETFAKAGGAGVTLSYVSADGENGYPGALTTQITYTLTNRDEVRIDYAATTDKPTIVNLTNHTYFNLAGEGVVYDHDLQVLASLWTPTDEAQIPTGEIASVEGTPFDLRQPARIGDKVTSTHPQMVLAKGYDHNFVLDKPAGDPLPVAVRVHDPKSGRRMEVRTSEPGVQVYTGNNLNGSVIGKAGTLRQSAGVAFETEHFPDSPNKPNFPSTVVRPGEAWRSTTVFRFSVDPR
jgi:aldose 1-epimerase